jgi:hypothetical protein
VAWALVVPAPPFACAKASITAPRPLLIPVLIVPAK